MLLALLCSKFYLNMLSKISPKFYAYLPVLLFMFSKLPCYACIINNYTPTLLIHTCILLIPKGLHGVTARSLEHILVPSSIRKGARCRPVAMYIARYLMCINYLATYVYQRVYWSLLHQNT